MRSPRRNHVMLKRYHTSELTVVEGDAVAGGAGVHEASCGSQRDGNS